MNEKVIYSGKTKYVWVTYEIVTDDRKKNIQIIDWPNSEGFTIVRDDDSYVDFDWCEWDALKAAIQKLHE